MAQTKTFAILGASFLLVSGALLCAPTAQAEPEQAPKSIRLGVDPNKYLQNRHRRVNQARRAAEARATAQQPAVTGQPEQLTDNLSLHPDLAHRPGFNEFSHLNAEERKNAQEIMQFLKNYQATQTP